MSLPGHPTRIPTRERLPPPPYPKARGLRLIRFARNAERRPLFKGYPPFRSETPHAIQPSRGFKPLSAAPTLPWPGFLRSSRTLFAQELHERSHQRNRSLSLQLVRPESGGSPIRSPRGGDSKGTSCRRVQSTFFDFQKRATTSRATTGFAFEPKPDRSPMDRSVHAERPALAGQPPNT